MKSVLFLIITGLILNLVAFIAYGIDKQKAKKNRWRIPEATLLLFALFGPLGALIGMKVWHHKTRKPLFFILVPVFLILQILLIVFVISHLMR